MKKNLLYVVLAAISLMPVAFIGGFLYSVRGEIKFADLSVQVAASFSGAFFAYLFLWIAGHLDKRAERETRAINALVKIQYLTNDALVRINNNRSDLNKFSYWAAACLKAGKLQQIYKIHVQDIPTAADQLNDLTNLEFTNKLYGRVVETDAINGDLAKIAMVLPEQIQLLLEEKIQVQDFLQTLSFLRKQVAIILVALDDAENGCIETMATARVLARQRSWLLRLRSQSFADSFTANDLMEMDQEKTNLRAEISENRAASAAKIKKMFGSTNDESGK